MSNRLAEKNLGRGVDLVSRVNPKYHFPLNLKMLERQIRLSFGLPIKGRMGGQLPFGYEYVEKTDTYEPKQDILELLLQARKYLYTSSLREVAEWLNYKVEKAGHKSRVSHQGLRNIMILRPPYDEILLPVEERLKLIEAICQKNKT